MTHFEPGYDVILIGAGESGRAALEALKEKGKSALYIELAPETVATMVSRFPLQTSDSGDSSSQPLSVRVGGQDAPIHLFSHTFRTPAGETVTYTMQTLPAEMPHAGHKAEEEIQEQPEDAGYGEEQAGWSMMEEPEVLEAEQVEYASPYQFVSEREAPIREKMSRRRKMSFQEHTSDQEPDLPVYTLERLKLDDEEDEEQWNSRPEPYAAEQGGRAEDAGNSYYSEQPPVYRERELKLRKRLFGIHRLNLHEQHEPASSNPPNNAYNPEIPARPYGQEPAKPESSSLESEPEVFHLEPFSRKRARSHKKARFQRKLEIPYEPQPAESPAMNSADEPDPSFFSPYPGGLFGGGQPSIQPFSRPSSDPEPESHEVQDALKKDDIELEDAYGGYNSWEEFLTPFSEGSRKRQELDKVEKRKIALRGLHNLINNLG